MGYESNHMTFWKRQNYGDSKKTNGFQGWKEGGMKSQSAELLRAVKPFCVIQYWCMCH